VAPGVEVDEVAPGTVDVGELGTDAVDLGDVEDDVVGGREVDVVFVDTGARGAVVESTVGSVVDVVRGAAVFGVGSNVPDDDGDSGRTSRNTASVTAKIAINTAVDLRRWPRIRSIPAPGCWSRGREEG